MEFLVGLERLARSLGGKLDSFYRAVEPVVLLNWLVRLAAGAGGAG